MTEYRQQAEMWVHGSRLREAEARIAELETELAAARRVVKTAEAHLSDSGPWSQLSDAIAAYRAAYPRD